MNPVTGPRSTSFVVHAVSFLTGLVGAASTFLVHGSAIQTQVRGFGGGALMLGSTIAKLIHDRGVHIATIQQAGADIGAALPQLRQDLGGVQAFVEQEWPGAKTLLAALDGRIHELEGKVAAVPGVQALTDAVLAAVRAALAGQAPPPPAL